MRALNSRGGALHLLNHLDVALASYAKALALEPRFAESIDQSQRLPVANESVSVRLRHRAEEERKWCQCRPIGQEQT